MLHVIDERHHNQKVSISYHNRIAKHLAKEEEKKVIQSKQNRHSDQIKSLN